MAIFCYFFLQQRFTGKLRSGHNCYLLFSASKGLADLVVGRCFMLLTRLARQCLMPSLRCNGLIIGNNQLIKPVSALLICPHCLDVSRNNQIKRRFSAFTCLFRNKARHEVAG